MSGIRVLHIDSSERKQDSVTRRVGECVVNCITDRLGSVNVNYRDLDDCASDLLDVLRAAESAPNAYTEQLCAADILIVGAPCYNGSVPWSLKAYIDANWRAGYTVTTKRRPARFLVRVKAAIVLTSYGGPGVDVVGHDIHQASLSYALNRIGIANTRFVDVRNTEAPDFALDLTASAFVASIEDAVAWMKEALLQ